ncbi:MAG: lipoyl(octanoyl) transferase LipB [Pseudomonadota bacterium]
MPVVEKNLRPCQALRLGMIEYEDALRLQNRLAEARKEEKIGDVLLLLQHPPVITMGKSGKVQNVLASPTTLQEKRIKVIFTDRGGDVTYHGPGQLVAYPILNLRLYGLSVPDYVWHLEEVVIRLLARFGISAGRLGKLRGVWVGEEKIASLGVHLSRWISKHGLALNINTDLEFFNFINPCGTGRWVTSMAKILKKELSMEEIETLVLEEFADVFGFFLCQESTKTLEPYL